jgi:hypothetical protein
VAGVTCSGFVLGAEEVVELGDHSGATHGASARVGQLSHVDRAGHIGVAMSEHEGDLIHAFASKQGAACDRVTEAVHRRQHSMRNCDRIPVLVHGVQGWEGRVTVVVDGFDLSSTQGASDVALTERAARTRREHEAVRANEGRHVSVRGKKPCQLRWNRDRSRRAVSLGRGEVSASINLMSELDLGVVDVVDPEVRPGESQKLGEPPVRAATVNSVRYGSPAAEIVCSSSPRSKMRRRLPFDGFGRSDESIKETGFAPAQPSRRAAYR